MVSLLARQHSLPRRAGRRAVKGALAGSVPALLRPAGNRVRDQCCSSFAQQRSLIAEESNTETYERGNLRNLVVWPWAW